MDWQSIGKQLANIGLPLLGGAVGGPGGALIGKTIAAALGLGADATPEQTATALGNMTGEQLVALRALDTDLAKERLKSDTSLALKQIETNQIEIQQPGLFKGGWRPGTGWVCLFGLGYTFLLRPLLPWLLTVCGVSGVPQLPPIDTAELLLLLTGMLGLAKMRSDERQAGAA